MLTLGNLLKASNLQPVLAYCSIGFYMQAPLIMPWQVLIIPNPCVCACVKFIVWLCKTKILVYAHRVYHSTYGTVRFKLDIHMLVLVAAVAREICNITPEFHMSAQSMA